MADGIHPLSPDQTQSERVPLLHVSLDENMGDRVWKLDLSDWPELHLNKRIEDVKAIARTAVHFQSLVFPSVVRDILREIVIEQEITDSYYDEDDWKALWLRFVVNLPRVPSLIPEAKADQETWIEAAVDDFCAYRCTCKRYAVWWKEFES